MLVKVGLKKDMVQENIPVLPISAGWIKSDNLGMWPTPKGKNEVLNSNFRVVSMART